MFAGFDPFGTWSSNSGSRSRNRSGAGMTSQPSTPRAPPTKPCDHCGKEVPASNLDLHAAHCARNLEKCSICGETVPRTKAEEHYQETHAPVACAKCGEQLPREDVEKHSASKCPQRLLPCTYCECPLAAVDLPEHEDMCGSRTDWCDACSKYVLRRERMAHEDFHHVLPEGAGATEGAQQAAPAGRPDRAPTEETRPHSGGEGPGRPRSVRRHEGLLLVAAAAGAAFVVSTLLILSRRRA